MTKVLVLYYSAYGHIEKMAYAVAEGAKAAGAQVDVKRVPELVPAEVAKASHFKLDQPAPIATVEELSNYDAIIFGSGTRFGTVTSQMRNFIDQTGGHWMNGGLVGKVGSAFTASATQHGGQESTILGFITTMLHHGMVVVGLPYAFQGQMGLDAGQHHRVIERLGDVVVGPSLQACNDVGEPVDAESEGREDDC